MTNEKVCCPKFEKSRWDNKTFNWKEKTFIKESMPVFFHIPFPPLFGKKVTKLFDMIKKAGADEALEDTLLLITDPSPWKSEFYMSSKKEVPDAENVTLSGTFESKVFNGPYNAVPKFMKEMDLILAEDKKKAKKYYIHYAYCPGCAKKFEHNYMILFAKVD